MKTHSSFPYGEYLYRILKKVQRLIEYHISEPTPDENSEKNIEQKIISCFLVDFPVFFQEKTTKNKAKNIHESVPCWSDCNAKKRDFKNMHTDTKVIQ